MAFAAVRLAEALVATPTMTRVSWLGMSGVACAIARTVGLVSLARLDAKLGSDVGLTLRGEITTSLLERGLGPGGGSDADRSSREPVGTGALVLAVRAVEIAAIDGVLGTVRAGLLLAPLAVALVVWLPPVVLVAALAFVPFAVVLSRVRGRVRQAERDALARGAALDGHLDDLLRNIDLFRVHGTRGEVFRAMQRLAQGSAAASASAAGTRALGSAMNEIVASCAVLAFGLAVAGGMLAIDPRRAAPALAIAFLLYRPLRDLGDARASSLAGRAALDVLAPHRAPLLDDDGSAAAVAGLRTAPSAPSPPELAAAPVIVLDAFGDARFGPRWTMTIAPHELVAIVGPVGAGKTTLFRALLGLSPSIGVATVAGVPLGDAPVDERPFAWVPQDVALVAGDLRHNLALGGQGVDEALQLLGSLAPTLDASLAVGRALSGGERALLAIARAVASGRPVLLLDEPSAHLDAEAEARVVDLLAALRATRTLVVISHRPALVAAADRVVEAPLG